MAGGRGGGRWIARVIATAPVDMPSPAGFRMWLALGAGLGGLAALWIEAVSGGGGQGGGGGHLRGGGTIQYEWDGGAAGWWDFGFPAAAFALFLAAVLLWVARRPTVLAAALLLVVVAPIVALEARRGKDDAGYISITEARAISIGTSAVVLRERLGPPIGEGEWHRGRRRAGCFVYFARGSHGGGPEHGVFSFCVADGRVVALDRS
jgi:hypothetical protein